MVSACPLDNLFKLSSTRPCRTYKCLQCGEKYTSKKESREHAVTNDQSLQPQLDEWLKKRERGDYSCSRCGRDLKCKQKLTSRMKFCGGTNTICKYCGRDFERPQWLRSHVEHTPQCLKRHKADDAASSVWIKNLLHFATTSCHFITSLVYPRRMFSVLTKMRHNLYMRCDIGN